MNKEGQIKSSTAQGFRTHDRDTGSAPVQVALLTERINHLSSHLGGHRKDHTSRRGLLKMIGKRASLLKYLHRTDKTKYQEVIQKLGIRK